MPAIPYKKQGENKMTLTISIWFRITVTWLSHSSPNFFCLLLLACKSSSPSSWLLLKTKFSTVQIKQDTKHILVCGVHLFFMRFSTILYVMWLFNRMSFVLFNFWQVCQLSPQMGSWSWKKQLEFHRCHFIVQGTLSATVDFVFESTFPGIVYSCGKQIYS